MKKENIRKTKLCEKKKSPQIIYVKINFTNPDLDWKRLQITGFKFKLQIKLD